MSKDTIYREDAIKAFDECLETSECGTMLSDEKYLDRLKAIPSADRWIPCSERLPERGEDVLITDEYGDVSIASIEYPTPHPWQSVYGTHIEYMVYAWMPLPEPWKGADDGEDIQSTDE